MEVGQYSFLLNKECSFLEISNKFYYYRASDGSYPLAIEITEQTQNFQDILKKNCNYLTSIMINKEGQIQQNKNISETIEYSGLKLGGTFETLGQYIGDSIENAGQFIAQKVESNEKESQIDPKIKNGLKTGKVMVETAAQYTGVMVGAGLQVVKSIGSEVIKNLPENDTMKKIQSSENYEGFKQVGYGAIKGTANIIGGIFGGVVNVAKGIGKATQTIVQKKYGNEAGEVVQDTTGIVTGVVQIDYSIKQAIIDDIKTKPKEQLQIEEPLLKY